MSEATAPAAPAAQPQANTAPVDGQPATPVEADLFAEFDAVLKSKPPSTMGARSARSRPSKSCCAAEQPTDAGEVAGVARCEQRAAAVEERNAKLRAAKSTHEKGGHPPRVRARYGR